MVKSKQFKLDLTVEFGDISLKDLNRMFANAFMEKLKTEGVKIMFKLEEVENV